MKTTWFYPMVGLAFTMGFTCFEIICCDDFSAESSAFHWDKFVEWLFGHHGVRRSIGGSIPGTKLVGLPRLAVVVFWKLGRWWFPSQLSKYCSWFLLDLWILCSFYCSRRVHEMDEGVCFSLACLASLNMDNFTMDLKNYSHSSWMMCMFAFTDYAKARRFWWINGDWEFILTGGVMVFSSQKHLIVHVFLHVQMMLSLFQKGLLPARTGL